MALYTDIATILNSLNAMARGEDAVASVDLTGAIAAVKSNIDSDDYKDAFMNSLCTVISKYTNRYTSFRVKYPAFNVDEKTFGGMSVKNDIAPFEAVTNTATGTGSSSYTPDYTAFGTPSVEQKFFIGFDKWAEKMKLPDDLFEASFHNESEMAAFLSAVMTAFSEAQIQHQNKAQDMALINFISEVLYQNKTVIDVAALYETQFGEHLTMEAFLHKQSCHQFTCMTIEKIRNYMAAADGSAVFNLENKVRRSDPEDLMAFFLADFTSAYKTYLLNGVSILNNDLLQLGAYYEVPNWQGSSATDLALPSLAANSKIMVKNSAGHTVDSYGIATIGAIIDKNALATSQLNYKAAADRFNGDGMTFFTQRAKAAYINDWSENAVVFIISDQSGNAQQSKKSSSK